MERGLEQLFWLIAASILTCVPTYAWRVRGRVYGIFALVILGVSLPGAIVMHWRVLDWAGPALRPWLDGLFIYSMAATGLHLAALARARLRHPLFRISASIPGQAFLAAGALSGVWLLALLPIRALLWLGEWGDALAALRWLDVIPFAVAGASLVTSIRLVQETVRIELAEEGPDRVDRVPVRRYRRWRRPAPLEQRPLRIVQISDPHLGPWQPVAKLRARVQGLVERGPDLVLLTGDFLTMEGQGTPGALAEALEPLGRVTGRSFAIFGNHDHEAPHEVRSALEKCGVRLLVDEETAAETPVGPVQIVGADYVGRDREKHIRELLRRFPRRPEHLRLFLLHDPLGFKHVPKGDVDLTLSGHTHGGQLGLVSFGLDWTVLSRSAWPDHGLFGHGPNRLYVHRGTGFYGFPLRIGVPGEASLLELVVP
jgi:predicted MPP superfamily phosphohydrolase